MAALMRHAVFKFYTYRPTTTFIQINNFASKRIKPPKATSGRKDYDKKQPPKIDSRVESIAARGFLRPQKAYDPPENVEQRLEAIYNNIIGDNETSLNNLTQKYELFEYCGREFNHFVPNSLLHTIENLNDLKTFYKTKVEVRTPLDLMKNMELPENLHVQFDYVRFHPDEDTKFGGQTAFNRSSTIVTGLKYKDKYKGHVQNQEWPFNS